MHKFIIINRVFPESGHCQQKWCNGTRPFLDEGKITIVVIKIKTEQAGT